MVTVKAMSAATVIDYTDVSNVKAWYLLVPRTSSAPTVSPTATETQMRNNGWGTIEPGVDTTKKLYKVDQCIFGDGTYVWGEVSLSSSYEAAIQAYNEAQAAKQTATNYVQTVTGDGIFVHSVEGGSSTSTGTGVHIGGAINIIKSGVSYIKAWISNADIPFIRIGREDKGNVLIDNDSVDIRDGTTKVASFTDSSITFYNANIPDKPIFDITAEATTDAISSAYLQRHSSGASEIDSKLMYVDQRISMDEYFNTTETGESINCSSGLYATSFISGVRTAEAGVVCSTELARDPVDGLTRDESLITLSADNIYFNNARTEERVLEIASSGYIVRACDGFLSDITPSSFKTPTAGTITSVTAYRHNGIIYMSIGFKNTSSVGVKGAVLDTTLDYENQITARLIKPVLSSYGIGYFNEKPLVAFIGASNGHFVVRNTSPSAVTVSTGATVTISWLAPLEGFSST